MYWNTQLVVNVRI